MKEIKTVNDLFSLLSSYDDYLVSLISTYPKEKEQSSVTYPLDIEKGFLLVYPQLRSKLNAVTEDCLSGDLCTLQPKPL